MLYAVESVLLCVLLQTRALAVQKTEEGELDEEAEWIFQNVFSKHPISKQVR